MKYILVLGLGLAFVQDNTTKNQVEDLIKKFESDDPQVRDKAVEEITAVGAKSIPFLLDAIKKTKDEEVKARCTITINRVVEVEAQKVYAKIKKPNPKKKPPKYKEIIEPKLCLKAYDCVEQVAEYFPNYRFYFATWFEDEPPFSLLIVTPQGEIKEDKIKGKGLLEEIKKLKIKIKDKEEARKFGLTWLAIQHACENFKVETTDHQNDVRY